MGCSSSTAASAKPAPVLLNSKADRGKAMKKTPAIPPAAPADACSFYTTKQLSVPLAKSLEKVHWKAGPYNAGPWQHDFTPGTVIPERADNRYRKVDLPDVGAVETSEQLCNYINNEAYYEHENYLRRCNLLPGVQGYRGTVTVFSDFEDPEKCFAVYRAKWEEGEVSDTFKALCKGALDIVDAPTPAKFDVSMEPRIFDGLYITKHLSVSLAESLEKFHWKAGPWRYEPEKDIPEIGDERIWESDLPGVGAVKTQGILRKYTNTEQYYEHEYLIRESALLPGVRAYIGNVTIFSDTQDPGKCFMIYRATWACGEVDETCEYLAHWSQES